ncbi:MAG: hypothetical protein RID07_04665, partial [Lacipirellulaceae bacterium]
KPETIENLGRLFSLQEAETTNEGERNSSQPKALNFETENSRDSTVVSISRGEEASGGRGLSGFDKSPDSQPTEAKGVGLPSKLEGVQDNAVFLNSETAAWLATLAEAQRVKATDIENASVGKVAYAQLLQQPEVYRGRIVTIHGTALREERLKPTTNGLGINTYHRLVVAPDGGGEFPFFAYVLSLPERFPQGNAIRQRVVVHGYFFKNYSYATDAGMSVAPVIVAKAVQWQPISASTPGRAAARAGLPPWWAIAAVAAFACLIVTLLHLNTRRKKSTRKLPQTANLPGLERLAEEESGE